jgi:hypothetical protein
MEGGLAVGGGGGGNVTRAGTKQISQRNMEILLRDPTRPHSHLSTRYPCGHRTCYFQEILGNRQQTDGQLRNFRNKRQKTELDD